MWNRYCTWFTDFGIHVGLHVPQVSVSARLRCGGYWTIYRFKFTAVECESTGASTFWNLEILSLILLLSNVVIVQSAGWAVLSLAVPARRYASAVLGMALCLSQSEFCRKGAQVGYSATYSPVVGQTKLTTLATVDGQFITQTVRYSTLRVRPHVAWVCLLLYTCCPFTITTGP